MFFGLQMWEVTGGDRLLQGLQGQIKPLPANSWNFCRVTFVSTTCCPDAETLGRRPSTFALDLRCWPRKQRCECNWNCLNSGFPGGFSWWIDDSPLKTSTCHSTRICPIEYTIYLEGTRAKQRRNAHRYPSPNWDKESSTRSVKWYPGFCTEVALSAHFWKSEPHSGSYNCTESTRKQNAHISVCEAWCWIQLPATSCTHQTEWRGDTGFGNVRKSGSGWASWTSTWQVSTLFRPLIPRKGHFTHLAMETELQLQIMS